MANMNLGHTENKNPVNLDEWVKQYMSDSQADVKELRDRVDRMWDTIYPVGSIYISMNGTNPGEIWGGTWVPWGSGRVPVGINGGDTDFNTVGKTGGSKSSVASHTHTFSASWGGRPTDNNSAYDTQWGGTNFSVSQNSSTVNRVLSTVSSAKRYLDYVLSGSTSTTGTSNGNLQPYITCYMWHRTA